MVERKVFLIKPKHQCHLSQWEEYIYGAHHEKKGRLLHELAFIPTDRQSLIPKIAGKRSFSYKTKASIHLSLWGEWVYVVQ